MRKNINFAQIYFAFDSPLSNHLLSVLSLREKISLRNKMTAGKTQEFGSD